MVINKLILTYTYGEAKSQNSQHNTEGEEQSLKLMLSEFKTYCKATVIKAV